MSKKKGGVVSIDEKLLQDIIKGKGDVVEKLRGTGHISTPKYLVDPSFRVVKSFTFQAIKRWFILRFKKKSLILIDMELSNGEFISFITYIKDGMFSFGGKSYIIDDSYKRYHHGTKLWKLNYHEDFVLPFDLKFPLRDTESKFQGLKLYNIHYHTQPSTLKTFLMNNVVQSSIKANSIMNFVKKLMIIVVIAGLISLVHMLIYLNESGFFKRVAG